MFKVISIIGVPIMPTWYEHEPIVTCGCTHNFKKSRYHRINYKIFFYATSTFYKTIVRRCVSSNILITCAVTWFGVGYGNRYRFWSAARRPDERRTRYKQQQLNVIVAFSFFFNTDTILRSVGRAQVPRRIVRVDNTCGTTATTTPARREPICMTATDQLPRFVPTTILEQQGFLVFFPIPLTTFNWSITANR